MFISKSKQPEVPTRAVRPSDELDRVRAEYALVSTHHPSAVEHHNAYAEFDSLARDARIATIVANHRERLVAVGTNLVTLLHNERRHRVGQFVILLRRFSKNTLVIENVDYVARRRNEDGAYSNFQHPHVSSDGALCTAERDRVLNCVRDGRLMQATKIVLDALWSYDPSHYCDIKEWPLYRGDRGVNDEYID